MASILHTRKSVYLSLWSVLRGDAIDPVEVYLDLNIHIFLDSQKHVEAQGTEARVVYFLGSS